MKPTMNSSIAFPCGSGQIWKVVHPQTAISAECVDRLARALARRPARNVVNVNLAPVRPIAAQLCRYFAKKSRELCLTVAGIFMRLVVKLGGKVSPIAVVAHSGL